MNNDYYQVDNPKLAERGFQLYRFKDSDGVEYSCIYDTFNKIDFVTCERKYEDSMVKKFYKSPLFE